MKLADVRGVAHAQRMTREVIHDVATGVRAGDTEREVARRIDQRLVAAGARGWLHTGYAWFGERTRFSGMIDWEPDALPTSRRLEEGEAFILDAAPLVGGYPSDYALCAIAGAGAGAGDGADHVASGAAARTYAEMLRYLGELKGSILAWAREGVSGSELFDKVGGSIEARRFEPVHPLYPGGVLGHRIVRVPAALQATPRIGDGFQLPLLAISIAQLVAQKARGAPGPLLNALSSDRPQGIYAIEPHLGAGEVGVKFESMLLVDGDETRWLDPELFGPVREASA